MNIGDTGYVREDIDCDLVKIGILHHVTYGTLAVILILVEAPGSSFVFSIPNITKNIFPFRFHTATSTASRKKRTSSYAAFASLSSSKIKLAMNGNDISSRTF